MIIKDKKMFRFIFIPGAIVFILSLSAFIYASPWENDLELAKIFEKALSYEVWKYWSQYYLMAGNMDLSVLFLLLGSILLQTHFQYMRIKKPASWYSNQHWLTKSIIIFAGTAWLSAWAYELCTLFFADNGIGLGNDIEIFDSIKYKIVGKLVASSYELPFLFFIMFYMIVRFPKRKDIFEQEYWIDAIKGLMFVFLNYFIIVFLKVLFGRPYYYNIFFGDFYSKFSEDWKQSYLNSGLRFGSFDELTNGYTSNINGEWPWWKVNAFFLRDNNSFAGRSFFDYAFPSGHVVSAFTNGTFIYLLVGKNKKRKLSNYKIILMYIITLHAISMNFATVVMRGHYITDTSFSICLCLVSIPIINRLVDKNVWKFVNKSRMKRQLENEGLFINKGQNIIFYVINNNRNNYISTFKASNKHKKEILIKKYLITESKIKKNN